MVEATFTLQIGAFASVFSVLILLVLFAMTPYPLPPDRSSLIVLIFFLFASSFSVFRGFNLELEDTVDLLRECLAGNIRRVSLSFEHAHASPERT